jgi:hypothetical protein
MVFVEDTYGVEFHEKLLSELSERRIVSGRYVKVSRLPSWICNQTLRRKLLARTGLGGHKTLIVIDSDGDPESAVKRVAGHLTDWPVPLRIVTVNPRHEAWLCIGLGLDRRNCRRDPEALIERAIGGKYRKNMLAKLARRVDAGNLFGEKDFSEYVNVLRELLQEP